MKIVIPHETATVTYELKLPANAPLAVCAKALRDACRDHAARLDGIRDDHGYRALVRGAWGK